MGFKLGAYAKIWKVEDKGNFSKVQMSVSKKNRQTDQYETEFSGFVNFVGHAHNKISTSYEGAKIKLGDCDVTTKYNKEKNVTYTNYALFEFEDADAPNTQPTDFTSEDIDEDTPF